MKTKTTFRDVCCECGIYQCVDEDTGICLGCTALSGEDGFDYITVNRILGEMAYCQCDYPRKAPFRVYKGKSRVTLLAPGVTPDDPKKFHKMVIEDRCLNCGLTGRSYPAHLDLEYLLYMGEVDAVKN